MGEDLEALAVDQAAAVGRVGDFNKEVRIQEIEILFIEVRT